MPTLYGPLDLVKNELRNAVVQNLGSAPASPVKGQMYFDSTGNVLYWYSGSAWVAAQGGASVSYGTVTTSAVGDASVDGVATTVSRSDHKHGRENFGAVTAETAAFGSASASGSATTVAHSDHTHGNPTHDSTAHSAIPLSALGVPTGPVSMNGQALTNLPASPVGANDAASKAYVDATAQGLDAKQSVHAATTANIANLATGAPNTLDGVTLAANDRVLVKDQTTQAQNGIYTITTLGTGANGVWARASDMDAWTEVPSAYVWVEQGTVWADTGWTCTADAGGTLGTTAITWVQFSSAASAIAGAGLTKTGNTIDLVAGDTSLTVAADSVVVNTSVIATQAYVNTAVTGVTKKYAAAITGTVAYATGEVVTHNLNTRDVDVQVVNSASPWQMVQVDWEATSVNTVTLRYNPNLGAGFRVVVIG